MLFSCSKKILFGILWLLFLGSCFLRPTPESQEKDFAFYRDEFNLETLVQSSDPPNRQASLRMIAKAIAEEQIMGNPNLIGSLEDALRIDPYNPYAYYYLSWAQAKSGQWQKSLTMAKRAEQLFAKDPKWQGKALVLQAKAEKALNHSDRAISLYQKAKTLDARNPLIEQGIEELGKVSSY